MEVIQGKIIMIAHGEKSAKLSNRESIGLGSRAFFSPSIPIIHVHKLTRGVQSFALLPSTPHELCLDRRPITSTDSKCVDHDA